MTSPDALERENAARRGPVAALDAAGLRVGDPAAHASRPLADADPEVRAALDDEARRQRARIELIASEKWNGRLPPLMLADGRVEVDPRGPTASKCQVVKSELFTGKPEGPR